MSQTISAVIIARNEEAVIERCIRSLLEVDEIILYDTGSDDRTVELAGQFGKPVRVHRQKTPLKPFHFARARTEAVACATSDWILTIDADEIVRPRSVKAMRKGIKKKRLLPVVGYQVAYIMRSQDEAPTHMYSMRLYRRGKWRWIGRVHNELIPIVAPAEIARIESATLEHLPNPEKRGERSEQTLQLLEMAIQEEPGRPRLRRHLALEYLMRSRPADAVPHIEVYNAQNEDADLDRSEGYCILGRALDRTGDLEGALTAFEAAAEIAPKRREPHYLGGRALMVRKQFARAAEWIERAVSIPISSKPVYHLNWESIWTGMPTAALVWCRQQEEEAGEVRT